MYKYTRLLDYILFLECPKSYAIKTILHHKGVKYGIDSVHKITAKRLICGMVYTLRKILVAVMCKTNEINILHKMPTNNFDSESICTSIVIQSIWTHLAKINRP